MTKRRFWTVKHDSNTVGLVIFHQCQQHRCKAVHRVCDLPTGIRHVVWKSKERSIRERVSIESHQKHVAPLSMGYSGRSSPDTTMSATAFIVVRWFIAPR